MCIVVEGKSAAGVIYVNGVERGAGKRAELYVKLCKHIVKWELKAIGWGEKLL